MLLTPLGDFASQRALWFAVNALCLAAGLWIVATWLGGRAGLRALLLIPLIWVGQSTLATLQVGNVHAMVVGRDAGAGRVRAATTGPRRGAAGVRRVLTPRPVGIVDGVDYMHSGVVRRVDAPAIRRAIDIGALVLLSPFGFSATGEAFNLTMEDVVTAAAVALQADKLLFLTEIPGIHEDLANPESPIDTEMALADARRMLSQLPPPSQPADLAYYLQYCVRACASGVERTHILPFSVDGALLLEVFTHDGIGTMIVDEKLESLHEATADDVGGIWGRE